MIDWDDLRTFLAVTRHGNLSAAARAMRVTQTTMGRRLEALHARAGARLLQKTPRGFVLTQAGERVLANVERMEAEAIAVERAIGGEDVRLEGQVRITTVEAFGARVLTPMLADHARIHPGISVELITDTRALSLSRREADIAVRLARFEQHEAVVRRAGEMAFGLYASHAYLAERGSPDLAAGSPGHIVVALQEDLALLPEARWLGELTHAGRTVLFSNSRDVHVQAALAGWGLIGAPRYLADEVEGLVRLQTPLPAVKRGIWIGVHRDSRHVPRIRSVLEHIGEALRLSRPRLDPDD